MQKLPLKLAKQRSGQALLLVLLSMAVVLTIVLSILSRSVTDIAVTSREEEALRAFSAAEAGFEQALIAGTDVGDNLGDASFSAQVTDIASGVAEYVYPTSLLSGESVVTWYVSHDSNGDLICDAGAGLGCYTGNEMNVCWGLAGAAGDQDTTPAIEVSVFYTDPPGDYSTATVARETVDSNDVRRADNRFSTPDGGTCIVAGQTFEFQKNIVFNDLGIPGSVRDQENGLQFARIRLLYNTDLPHPVGVIVSGGVLPSQGKRVESTGLAGESTRKIEVFQSFPEPPPIFDSGVFTLGNLEKI